MSKVLLKWVDPTTQVNTDGTTGPIDAGFSVAVFDDTAPATPIGTVAAGVQTFTTGVLTPGVHTFAVVIVSAKGVSSVPSNTATVTIGAATPATPSPVTGLTAVEIP
jgi:hypothetical protein